MTHKEYLVMVGLKIRIARLTKKLTIMDVCKLSGLEDKAISAVENGKKDSHILTFKRIADALGVDMKDFM